MRATGGGSRDDRHWASNAALDLSHTIGFVELCYEYALLHARQEAGVLLDRTAAVRREALATLLDAPGSLRERRAHKRRLLALQARIKSSAGTRSAVVLNASVGGLLVEVAEDLPLNETVQVTIGEPQRLLFVFFCEVLRKEESDRPRFGLRFRGAPLRVRYGDSAPFRSNHIASEREGIRGGLSCSSSLAFGSSAEKDPR